MNKTEAEIKLAIATLESVEQHLDLTKKAIAHDACCKSDSYHHVFDGMIQDLIDCRETLQKLVRSVSHSCIVNRDNLEK
ncbi:MAG: hypothetical protein ACRC2S_28490 [Waterburya sp.]